MIAKRRPGRPTKAEDSDLNKIRVHLLGNSFTYITRLERIAGKCYGLAMGNPSAYSKELKTAADIYLKLADIAGIKPRDPLIQLTNNQNNLVAGTPEYYLNIASQAQETKRLSSGQSPPLESTPASQD